MMDWYFEQTNEKIWLGTEQNTKAELFYKNRGWTVVGIHGKDETKFEITYSDWKKNSNYDKRKLNRHYQIRNK